MAKCGSSERIFSVKMATAGQQAGGSLRVSWQGQLAEPLAGLEQQLVKHCASVPNGCVIAVINA
jgi:hypothetical protein